MKIKTDFITNSSSSSFIVAFTKKIETVDDVKKFITRTDFAKTVFNDAMKQTPLLKSDVHTQKYVVMEMNNWYVDDEQFISILDEERQFIKREGITSKEFNNNPQWNEIFWDERILKQNSVSGSKSTEFLGKLPDESYIYIFTYSDNDGEYFSEMEHGNIFKSIPHIRVNKH